VRKIFVLIFLLFSFSSQFAQIIIQEKVNTRDGKDYTSAMKVFPEKPKAGDKIKITFDSKGTNLENASSIVATYVAASEKVEEFNSVPMKMNNNLWEAELIIPANANILGIMFESDETFFTNNAKGYFVRKYNEQGEMTVESLLAHLNAQYTWGPRSIGLGVYREVKPAELAELNIIFTDNPNLRGKFINLLLRSTVKNREKGDNASVLKIVDEYRTKYANTEDDYKNIIYGYQVIGERAKSTEAFNEGALKFPQSEYFIVNREIQTISKESDPQKKNDMLEALLKKYPDQIDVERYFSSTVHLLIKGNDPTSITEFLKRFKTYMNAEIAISASKNIDKDSKDMNLLSLRYDLAKYATEFAEKEFVNPTRKRPEFASDKAFLQKRRNSLVWAYIHLGNMLSEEKKYGQALTYFDKMAKLISVDTYKDLDMMTNYSASLVEAKRFDEGEKIITHAVNIEKVTSDMKETLRKIYLNKYGDEKKYLAYIATFEDKLMKRIKEEFKPKLVNTPAPNFILKDMSGKIVSLADYKGKIVILDFWATWCAPCQASFPGMQKVINKFASDSDVVFLFINTSEKEADIEKKIAKWQAAKKYTFQILLDKDYKVRDAYNARSIPHKFFIDQNGNIRLESVGYSGGADKLVDEITAVISLIREK